MELGMRWPREARLTHVTEESFAPEPRRGETFAPSLAFILELLLL